MARHCHTEGGGEFSGGNVGLGCEIPPPGRWRARTRFARNGQAWSTDRRAVIGGTLRSIDRGGRGQHDVYIYSVDWKS